MNLKKILNILVRSIFIFFFLVGLYNSVHFLQYEMTKASSEKVEASWDFDPNMWYNKNGGEPLFLVNPQYDRTIFFMEGFRTQNPAGMYMDWFEELHEREQVNVIVPIYGLQSSPFLLRNRDWNFREDLRTVTQIYDGYVANLDDNHEVITISQSFGTLPHLGILSWSDKKPFHSVFLSPLNSHMEYRAAGDVVHWLSKQNWWLHKVIAFTKPSPPPNRNSVWDIVNEEKNKKYAELFPVNPEDR